MTTVFPFTKGTRASAEFRSPPHILYTLPDGGELIFQWEPPPEELAAEANQAADNLDNMYQPLEISQELVIKGINVAFDTKTSPEGGAWAPWSEAGPKPTYADRAASRNVGGLLERDGTLRAMATSPSSFRITKDSLFYTALEGLDYSAVQQLGGLVGTGVKGETGNIVPPRPYVGVSADTEEQIFIVWDEWFDSSLSVFTHASGYRQLRVSGGRFGPGLGFG